MRTGFGTDIVEVPAGKTNSAIVRLTSDNAKHIQSITAWVGNAASDPAEVITASRLIVWDGVIDRIDVEADPLVGVLPNNLPERVLFDLVFNDRVKFLYFGERGLFIPPFTDISITLTARTATATFPTVDAHLVGLNVVGFEKKSGLQVLERLR